MNSLWSDAEAQAFIDRYAQQGVAEDLALRVYSSRLLGADPTLVQHGQVDLCIVGSDRTTAHGDVCNKIGTYLKALAAHDNGVPFYAALPVSTIDWSLAKGSDIPIEERSASEVSDVSGLTKDGRIETVRVIPQGSPAANPAFDVTPARLVTGLITERGIVAASKAALTAAFPERVVDEDRGVAAAG